MMTTFSEVEEDSANPSDTFSENEEDVKTVEETMTKVKIDYGQGIVAAPKAYFAKQSMERKRNCEKPGFCRRQKWPQKKENV